MRRISVRCVCVEAKSSFFLTNDQPSSRIQSMSNAESDRKPDGSAEDDDEPDEWCADAQIPYDQCDADEN